MVAGGQDVAGACVWGGPVIPPPRTLWPQVHATLELFALMVVVFELCMKLRWLGLHTFIRHKRTMVKVMRPSPESIFFPTSPSSSSLYSNSKSPRGPHSAPSSVMGCRSSPCSRCHSDDASSDRCDLAFGQTCRTRA